MGKDVIKPCENETEQVETKKVSKKTKKSRKSKKNRKSDPEVNDISNLLSSSLNLVSPNVSFNKEKQRNSLDSTQNGSINNKSNKKGNNKSLKRNVSSSSLDNFVIRTSRKSDELKENTQVKEILLSEDDFEVKENFKFNNKDCEKPIKLGEKKKNAFHFMMNNRNKVIESNSPVKELKLKENGLKEKEDKKGGQKRRNEEIENELKLDERAKRLKKIVNGSEENDSLISPKVKDKNLNRNKQEEKPDEDILKIKMFSPQVFKRKRIKQNGNKLPEKNVTENDINLVKIDEKSSTPTKSKKSLSQNLKQTLSKTLHYSENSDSNDSDIVILRRSTRKRTVKKFDDFLESEDSNDVIIDVENEEEKMEKSKTRKPSKLAPVFLLSTPKPKLDPQALEAKKKFLNSGIPESLKKVIEKEKIYQLDFDVFPKISHVQQKTVYKTEIDFWNLPKPDLKLNLKPQKITFNEELLSKGSITNLTENNIEINLTVPTKLSNFKEIMQKIKEDNPIYPVYKCFRILNEKIKLFERNPIKKKGRKSKESVNKDRKSLDNKTENVLHYEMWTEKYKPITYEEILGNSKKVLELKNWLESWVEYINDVQSRNKINGNEFYTDSNSNSSNFTNLTNAIILTGPFGSGKTMTIYALCNELRVNIIELNASSKRTGKLLQEIQEATQSHQVRKNEPLSCFLNQQSTTSNSISSSSLTTDKNKLCLILIEDLDIIFDQDEGFLNALNQLLLTTKRPIVITTTDINANILQKFVNQYPIVRFSGFSLRVLGVWLQIVCLFEGVVVDLEDLGKVLEFFNGDIRKTLIQMQFFIQSGGSLFKDLKENNLDDNEINDLIIESKSGDRNVFIHNNFVYNFLDRDCLVYDFNLEKIWWNLPIILNEKSDLKKCRDFNEILSFIDMFYRKTNLNENENNHNSIQNLSYLKDNIVLNENFKPYKNNEFIKDLSNTLLKHSIDFYNEIGKFEFDKPTLGQKRWIKKHKDCSETFSHFAPFTFHTDKKSFALDYYPNLRAISRSEKHRASVNVKRKNRFYNYFKSLDFTCSESTTETVCKIFSIENDKSDEM